MWWVLLHKMRCCKYKEKTRKKAFLKSIANGAMIGVAMSDGDDAVLADPHINVWNRTTTDE